MPFRISTDWFDDCESELSFGPHKFTFRKNISKHINLVCEWIDMCVCVCVASASAHFSNNKRYKFTSIFRSHGYLTWSLLLLLSLKPYMWVCVLCRAAFVLFYAHLRFYLPICRFVSGIVSCIIFSLCSLGVYVNFNLFCKRNSNRETKLKTCSHQRKVGLPHRRERTTTTT